MKTKQSLLTVVQNPAFRGKHIVMVGGEVFATKTGQAANKLLAQLEKRYPHEVPAITYVPKMDTLILCH